jgi:anti-sigma B factor antagonist
MNSDVKVVQPVGILDGIHGNRLRQEIADLVQAGIKHILIDCSQISFVDSSGLGALVMMMKAAKQAQGQFAICSVNDQVKILLDITSMDRVLTILPNQAAFFSQLLVA